MDHLVSISYQTCSPHTGIETRRKAASSASLASRSASAYQTCSPHTGIETELGARLSELHDARAYQTCSPHTGIETRLALQGERNTRGEGNLYLPNMFPAHGD